MKRKFRLNIIKKRYKDQKRYLFKPKIKPIKFPKNITIKQLVSAFSASGAFNAGRLAEACKIYKRMLDKDAVICLTLAGAMTPTGLGGPIIQLIKNGFIDFIISTGANLYHDMHFALDLPVYQGDFRVCDEELFKRGIERIYDIFITDNDLIKTDKFLQKLFVKKNIKESISSAELLYMIGKSLLNKAPYPTRSLVAQAAKYDVPLYVPALSDSSIGMNLALVNAYSQLRGTSSDPINIDHDLDVLETTAIVHSAKKNGAIEIGGGVPKNFYMQTQPMLWQVFDLPRGGHDYFIQITTDSPQWGGLSGATPQEAVSWGKVNPKSISKNDVVVYSDATIAAPILFAFILTSTRKKKLKRLYKKRKEYLDKLRRHIEKKRVKKID